MANIKVLVENPHPIYLRNLNYWNFLLDSYEGGMNYTGADVPKGNIIQQSLNKLRVLVNGVELRTSSNVNLFQHKKERAKDFNERIRMSYYYNFTAPIIDIYTDHLFKQPILEDWDDIEDTVNARMENIDRMGSSIDEFRRSVADLSQIYGHSFILIDMPKSQNELSLQDRQKNDQFPYFVQYHPQMVLNWSLDEFGKPYWVLLKDIHDANPNWEAYSKDEKNRDTYRIWTRDKWYVFNGAYEQIEEGINPLKSVPLVCVKDKPSKRVKDFLGISSVADIAFIARDVYNLSSELQEITRNQTFAFLALQGKATDYNELVVGTNRGLIYPQDTNKPEYISPPSDNAKVLMEQIDRQVDKMFQLAKLEAGSASYKGQNAVEQSGVSKAWDFNQTNSSLSKKSQNYEDGEIKAWQMFAKWEGKEFNGSVSYPSEFSMQSLIDDLNEAQQLFKLNLGKMVNDEVKKAIIQKKFPRISDEEIGKMIDDMKQTPEQQVVGNGQPKDNRLFNRLGLIKKTVTEQEQNRG